MARRVHFAVESLPPEGFDIVDRGLKAKKTYAAIIREVEAATGKVISQSSMARYASSVARIQRDIRASQIEAEAMMAKLQEGDKSAHQIANALIASALFHQREMLKKADAVDLSREERQRRKLELLEGKLQLDREQIELRKREVAVIEKKLEETLEKQRKAQEALEAAEAKAKRGEQLTIADINQMRAAYNLKPIAEANAGA